MFLQSYEEDFEEEEEEDDSKPSSGKAMIGSELAARTRGRGGEEPSGGGMAKEAELLELMQAMEMENQLVKKASEPRVSRDVVQGGLEWPPLSVQPATGPANEEVADNDRGTTHHHAPSSTRAYVDFSTAQERSRELRAARRTKKRGQVLIGEWNCLN